MDCEKLINSRKFFHLAVKCLRFPLCCESNSRVAVATTSLFHEYWPRTGRPGTGSSGSAMISLRFLLPPLHEYGHRETTYFSNKLTIIQWLLLALQTLKVKGCGQDTTAGWRSVKFGGIYRCDFWRMHVDHDITPRSRCVHQRESFTILIARWSSDFLPVQLHTFQLRITSYSGTRQRTTVREGSVSIHEKQKV